jgi:hypothetical protein
MASQLVSVRFPTGESEFRITAEVPKLGDTLTRGDEEWPVSHVGTDENDGTIVTLGQVGERTTELGASGAGIPPESYA